MRASQAVRQSLWAQPRAFSTSAVFRNEVPGANSYPPPPPPPSSTEAPGTEDHVSTSQPVDISQYLSKTPSGYTSEASAQMPPRPPKFKIIQKDNKPKSIYSYDATSDAFDIDKISGIIKGEAETFEKKYSTLPQMTDLRTRPQTGRTIHVGGSMDLSRAFKNLEMAVRRNHTKRMWQTQRQHERPGLRRKRLNSERWRRRFKSAFVSTVSRVQELTNQGW